MPTLKERLHGCAALAQTECARVEIDVVSIRARLAAEGEAAKHRAGVAARDHRVHRVGLIDHRVAHREMIA